MRKRKLLAWILTVVMLFTVLGAFPMTVSAADANSPFSVTVDGATTYYDTLLDAINAVPNGGTIEVLKDFEVSSLSEFGKTWTSVKTYTINGNNKKVTHTANQYALDFYWCNATINDLTVEDSGSVAQVPIRVWTTADVTLKNCTVTATYSSWGTIADYGKLTLDNTTVKISGGTQKTNSGAIRIQPQSNSTPMLTLKNGAALIGENEYYALKTDGNPVCYITIEDEDVVISGSITKSSAASFAFGIPANDASDEILEKWTALRAIFGNPTTIATAAGKAYTSLVHACNEVAEGGTVEITADYSFNGTYFIGTMHEAIRALWSGIKTYTINGNNHTATLSGNRPYNFANSNVTINNLKISTNTTVGWVRSGSTVTLNDCEFTSSANAYGVVCLYNGTLSLTNTKLIANGTATDGHSNSGIYVQARNLGGDNDTTKTPTIVFNAGTTVSSAQQVIAGNATVTINVNSSDVALSTIVAISGSSKVTYSGPSASPTAAELAAWKPIYSLFGSEWPYEAVAKIGAMEYTTVSEAITAVEEGGTITLVADLTTGIVANNNKTFTIDGGGHTVAVNGSQALTVNAGTTLTVINITLQSTTARNAVDLAGGALTLGNGAVVKSIYTNASGNSAGNGIRGTAAGSVLNVLDGATIQAGGGAIVFDGVSATINISGGTITTDYYFMVFTGGGILDVTISGGTLTSTAATTANNAGAFRYYGGTHSLVITGGTIKFANKTSMFGSASSLTAMKTPDWVRILGGKIEKTTAGEEATLDVDSLKSAVAGLSVTSGAAQLRIPVQASFGNSGIAFATTVDKATYDALVATYGAAAVKTGTLILPTATVPAELTYDNIVGLGTGKFLDVANSGFYNEETAETDGNYLWYGSIVNIKAKNTNRDFTGVGYIGVTTSVASIGSVTVAVCGAGTVANARTLATAAEEGNAAQNDLLNFFKTGEMPF